MSITYLEAIREAQAKLLRDDQRVFIYGQDVGGNFGGAFKATKGLAKEFPGRVLNTPISEDAILGTFFQHCTQPNLKPRRHALLANRRGSADHRAFAFRWDKRQRAVSQSIDGIDLRALSRTDRHDARDGGRRLHHAH